MDVWVLDTWHGEPVNAAPGEHDALAWVTPGDLDGLDLAPGVLALVRRVTGGDAP